MDEWQASSSSGADKSTRTPPPGPQEFQPGDMIGQRYRVINALGRGGMGMVYLVKDRKTRERVALKCILPEYAGKKAALRRFEREVEVARQLDHPSIVKVFDAWHWEGMLMYTMEYVEGQSLYHLIRKRGSLGLGSTVRILSLLCHALEHAHRTTIHRDISPGNIMVLANGSVKLLDFGLAKLTDRQTALTMLGASLGKVQYIAPEQRVSARDVDHRADLFSLGIMFYEMLTGRLPDLKEPVPIRGIRPDLPKQCDKVFQRAVAQLPEDRYYTAREMREALAWLYGLHQRKSQGWFARLRGWARKPLDAPGNWWRRIRARKR